MPTKESPEELSMAVLGNMYFNSTGARGFNETEEDTSEKANNLGFIIADFFSLLISLLGMIGNSLVFWYLSFRIKRTKYTVYIINLAIADFIYLIFFSIKVYYMLIVRLGIVTKKDIQPAFSYGLEIMENLGMLADMFLLTGISVERCLAVFYPVWYRCNRPKSQSVIVCVFLWGLSILVTLVVNLGCPPELIDTMAKRCTVVMTLLFVLVILVCTPIMVVSSLILLIRIRKTSKQHQPRKLFIVIVTSVIIFLISVAPWHFVWFLGYLQVLPSSFPSSVFFFTWFMWMCIHSSINPFIYFLVGRHKMQVAHEYIIRALKKVFREVEEEGENGDGVTSDHEGGNTSDYNVS